MTAFAAAAAADYEDDFLHFINSYSKIIEPINPSRQVQVSG
jgi:hypothetical protein